MHPGGFVVEIYYSRVVLRKKKQILGRFAEGVPNAEMPTAFADDSLVSASPATAEAGQDLEETREEEEERKVFFAGLARSR